MFLNVFKLKLSHATLLIVVQCLHHSKTIIFHQKNLRLVPKMADYWDEHGANEDEYIEDIFDFIRRLNSGQLPSHWHLEDYADLRLPANVVRMLFDNNPGSQRKTSEWFIEAIEENDSFPGEF